MALTEKEKSEKYRERQKKKKLSKLCGWVKETTANKVDRIIKKKGFKNRGEALEYFINK